MAPQKGHYTPASHEKLPGSQKQYGCQDVYDGAKVDVVYFIDSEGFDSDCPGGGIGRVLGKWAGLGQVRLSRDRPRPVNLLPIQGWIGGARWSHGKGYCLSLRMFTVHRSRFTVQGKIDTRIPVRELSTVNREPFLRFPFHRGYVRKSSPFPTSV